MKKYKLNHDIVLREFRDFHYVINIENGDIRDFTEVGFIILKKCTCAMSAVEITKELGINSELEKDKAKKIEEFLKLLHLSEILDLVE